MKRVLKYLEKDIFTLIVTFILAIISVVLTIYVPILFGSAIDLIVGKNNVDFDNLIKILIKVVICVGATGIVQWIMMLLNNMMAYRITKRLRKESFDKIQVLPLKFLDAHAYGELVNVIINDVDQFAEGLLLGFTQFFTGIATIIGTIVFMISINWVIALVVVVVTPLSLFVAKFIATKTYSLFRAQSELKATQMGFIDEMIGNLKVVEAYNHEDENLEAFDVINDTE